MDETTPPSDQEVSSPEMFHDPVEVSFGDVVDTYLDDGSPTNRISVVVGTGKHWLHLSEIVRKGEKEELAPSGTVSMKINKIGDRWDKDKVLAGMEWMWNFGGKFNPEVKQAVLEDIEEEASKLSVVFYASRQGRG